MSETITFTAVIEATGGGGAYVLLPFDPKIHFGKSSHVKVIATFDGEPYRGSIANMGAGPMMPILKAIRGKIGKQPGDRVEVTLRKDTEERIVVLPEDALKALRKYKEAESVYEKLSYTHRREYVTWIESAKKEETRIRRIEKFIEMLLEKTTK